MLRIPGRLPCILILPLLLLPAIAQAHTGAGAVHGFAAGLHHPLTGVDHLLAMLAVGLWAAQMSGQLRHALWALPLAFVSLMTCGSLLGANGIALPFVEQGIALSILLPGVLIATAVRLPLAVSVVLVGSFAICHGHAHGSEMPLDADGLAYGAGFLLATAGLHGLGIAPGAGLERLNRPQGVRLIGAAIALCGAGL